VLAVVGLVAIAGAIEPAVGAKKRKPAVTRGASTQISPGSLASATAGCSKGTHVTGGGWSITGPYNPVGPDATDPGTRITHIESRPNRTSSWTASAASFNLPANSSTFTTFARCESNAAGIAFAGVSGTSTIPVGQQSTTDLRCPRRSHVLSGGFGFSPSGDPGDPGAFRAVVVESRRLDRRTWRIALVNPAGASGPATLFTNAICEPNLKGLAVTEASSTAPIAPDDRTSLIANCTGKKHTIGGGFATTPVVGPAIGIDQMQPVGSKGWQVGLYEYPGFTLPAGSTVTAYGYCKRNALPNPKR
jgi:hypothetical protein